MTVAYYVTAGSAIHEKEETPAEPSVSHEIETVPARRLPGAGRFGAAVRYTDAAGLA
jgi:hypothetical protein